MRDNGTITGEVWTCDRKGDLHTEHQCIAHGLTDPASDADDANMRRLELAACSPEMARLLLELEDAGYGDGSPECPICAGGADPKPVRHLKDCALDALLRKAGIR